MKIGVIDVGSNSVRLLSEGRKTVINTQLAENLKVGGCLLPSAMERTVNAIISLKNAAEAVGNNVYVFATEAVRSAANKKEFLDLLALNGINLDILEPKTEALIGFEGAYFGEGKSQAVLDVGGASSEIAVGDDKSVYYSHSLPLGAVRLKDYSLLRSEQEVYAKERVKEYGEVPSFDNFVTIGGTTSSLATIRDKVEPYDPDKIHKTVLSYDDIDRVVTKIDSTPIAERAFIKGLHPQKILLVPAGGVIVMAIMEYLNIKSVTVSENDNLEGYLKRILKKIPT